jgi:3-oxoacyl-[acyl-carrier protein] reductase
MAERRILITGATSDIGMELIPGLMTEGAHVVGHGYSGLGRLQSLAAANPSWPGRLMAAPADLREESGIQSLIASTREALGFPNSIVHLSAAKLDLKRFGEFDWGRLELDMHVQLKSIGLILKAFLPEMARSGEHCKVVFMLSSATLGTPPKYMTEYTVVKYAMLGLLRSLAAEYADKTVSFNAVSPSMIETQFLANVPGKFVEMAAAAHPAKRNAKVADVVPAIRFLLSGGSDYMSGANIPITAAGVI